MFPDDFFLLSVWSPWAGLRVHIHVYVTTFTIFVQKGVWKPACIYNVYCVVFLDNVYTGTQNELKLEILIHTLELKFWHFEVPPYVCIGKPCICNVFRPHAT